MSDPTGAGPNTAPGAALGESKSSATPVTGFLRGSTPASSSGELSSTLGVAPGCP